MTDSIWTTCFIEAVGAGMVNIDRAYDADTLVRKLEFGSIHSLRVALAMPGDHVHEIQRKFAHRHLSRNWYSFSDDIKEFVSTVYREAFDSTGKPTASPQVIHRAESDLTAGDSSDTSLQSTARDPGPTTVLLRGAEDRVCVPAAGGLSSSSIPAPSKEPPLDHVQGGSRAHATRLVNAFIARVNAARRELDPNARPITIMDRGGKAESDLRARLSASSDPAADLDHVLTIAIAEARSKNPPELRWLSWSLANEKTWDVKLASTLAEVERRAPKSQLQMVKGSAQRILEREKGKR